MQCPCEFPLWQVWLVCCLMTKETVQQSQELVFTNLKAHCAKSGQITPLNSSILVICRVVLVCLLCYIRGTSVSCFMLLWLPPLSLNIAATLNHVLCCTANHFLFRRSFHYILGRKKEIILKKLGQAQQCKLFTKHIIKQQLQSFCQHVCLPGFCTLYVIPSVPPARCDTN